ncbi:MAG: hypothetical protein HZC54_19240 [Verrucomicrobia bacterium]|nr:hypothetical protein [Verrucomicrobiota bacterium]
MSAIAVHAVAETETFAGLARAVVLWLRNNSREAAVSAVTGAAIGYAANALLACLQHYGYDFRAGLVTTRENLAAGNLFWALANTIVFAVVGYWRAVGTKRFLHDVLRFPLTLANLFRQDGRGARKHLFWGAAISLLGTELVSPWLGAVAAVGVALALPSVLGRILADLLRRAWSAVIQCLTPDRERPLAAPTAMMVGLIGTAAALAIGFFVENLWVKFGLAAVCAALALIPLRIRPATKTAGLGVMLLTAGLCLTHAAPFPEPMYVIRCEWAKLEPGKAGGPVWWVATANPDGFKVRPGYAKRQLGGPYASQEQLQEDYKKFEILSVSPTFPLQVYDSSGKQLHNLLTMVRTYVAPVVTKPPPERPETNAVRRATQKPEPTIARAPPRPLCACGVGCRCGEKQENKPSTASLLLALLAALASMPGSSLGAALGLALGGLLGQRGKEPPGGSEDSAEPSPNEPIIDPYTGEPLTQWQPGMPGDGEPGMVQWGDKWLTPEDARDAIQEAQLADLKREQEQEQKARDADESSLQAIRNRAQEMQREADAERSNQDQIDRHEAMIDKLRDDVYEGAQDKIDRILQGIRAGGPTPENVEAIRRLTHSLGDQVAADNERESATWEYIGDVRQINENLVRTTAMMGQFAAAVVENTLLPGSRGMISGFIYGAAGHHEEGIGSMVAHGSLLAMGNLIGSRINQATGGNVIGNILANTAAGASISAGQTWLTGGSPEQIRDAAGWGALFGGGFSAAGHAAQAMRGGAGAGSGGGGAGAGGGRGIEVVQPGGPRPYTSPKGVNWGRPPASRGSVGEGAVTPGGSKPFVSPRSEQWGRPPASAGKTPAAEPGSTTPRSAAPAKPAKQTPPSEDDIRQALKTQKEQQRREIDLPHQDPRVQRMAKTLHNENEMPMVDKRQALEQLTDTRSSRTAKQAPKDVQEAIINTREQKLYKPADQATINQVSKNPAVQKMMRPGDKLVMDSFQTPGKSGRSVGADRDARLVIQRSDGTRIEVPRKHWENQAYKDFYNHTSKIYTEGITPKTHPRVFERAKELKHLKNEGLSDEQILHRAYAEEHNQLFTDKHHAEASRDNSDQFVRVAREGVFNQVRTRPASDNPDQVVRTVHQGRRIENVQDKPPVLDVKKGKAGLADPEGYSRMWQEKSRFYHDNPPEALAQSQKGIAEMMDLRAGYRQGGLEPPPIPKKISQAMDIIIKAPVGKDATPEAMARINEQLRDPSLGFKDMHDAMNKIAQQNELLKWSRPISRGN